MKKRMSSLFVKVAFLTGLSGSLLVPFDAAFAASCNAKASRLAASQGGSVLSVRASGNKCVIKLLVKSASGPPKRKTFVVPK